MQKVNRLLLPLFLIGTLSATVPAQMFSVSERPQRLSFSNTFIRVGTSITDFTYVGNINTTGGSALLNVSDPILSIMLDGPGLNASAIIGNDLIGLNNQSFFDLNLEFSNGFPIVRQPRVQVGIPIQLLTGITTSNSDELTDRFSQTNIAAGIGGFINFAFTRRVRFETQGITGYGFSNSSGGFFGGNIFYIQGEARLNILNFIGNRALSIGYDYNFKSFDVDDDIYDFELNAHQITLGVSL